MSEVNGSNNNKEVQYIRDLARRAFRNVTRIEDTSIKNVEERFDRPKHVMPKNSFPGLGIGVTVGIIICIATYLTGVPFNRVEAIFVTAQFGLLGALMSYINS
ncbi:MAG: hypothetical protein NTZ10_04290 [Candidatus Saganbacteria bacterium]|nr:hypothetical protein [Candidatus Saganbacteria bacterium]